MSILYSGKSTRQLGHSIHHHNNWEIISNIAGSGVMEFEGFSVPFDNRTIVCIPPKIGHAKHSENGFRDLWVWFTDLPFLDATRPTILTDDSERNITSLIKILYSVQYGKAPNKQNIMDSLLDSIQQLLLSRLERHRLDPRVEQIVEQIVLEFQDPAFSLDECLMRGGYCTDHMRRLFREQTGKTPHEYLAHLRIKTAKKLLASRKVSNYSVTEIAEMVGFHDVSYFSRIFKKATGISPGEYQGE